MDRGLPARSQGWNQGVGLPRRVSNCHNWQLVMSEKSTKTLGYNSLFMTPKSSFSNRAALDLALAVGGWVPGLEAQDAPAAAPAAEAAAPAVAPSTESDANYVIGPGDSLNVQVWGHEDLTTTVA